MLGEFWKSVSGEVADRWAGLGAAVVFWAGLLLVWLWAHGGWHTARDGSTWLEAQSTVSQLVVLLAGFLLTAAPAVLVARVTEPVLRLLEGYWPTGVRRVWRARVGAHQNRLDADQQAFQKLAAARHSGEGMARDQADEYARLDWSMHHTPGSPDRVMPTRVGNVLRTAEDRPRAKYGLDAVIVWPRLWLLLPEATRAELAAARGALDSAVAAVVWGLVFAAAVPVAVGLGDPAQVRVPVFVGVAAGVGVALAAGVWWVPRRSVVFADLLESAFDLYRLTLYETLHWPIPANPAAEYQSGQELTTYLWRGSRASTPVFVASRERPGEVGSDVEPGS